MITEREVDTMMSNLNRAFKRNYKKKREELAKEDLSFRTFNRKKVEMDKWVDKEKKELKVTKNFFMQGCMRLSSLLDHLMAENSRVKTAVKSIRNEPDAPDSRRTSGAVRRS